MPCCEDTREGAPSKKRALAEGKLLQDSSSNLQRVFFSSNSSDYIEVIQRQSAMPELCITIAFFG